MFNIHKPERKSERMVFLVSPTERLDIEIQAEDKGLSVSEYCRVVMVNQSREAKAVVG